MLAAKEEEAGDEGGAGASWLLLLLLALGLAALSLLLLPPLARCWWSTAGAVLRYFPVRAPPVYIFDPQQQRNWLPLYSTTAKLAKLFSKPSRWGGG